MTKFSLLCPSRNRLDMLENLIQSIINTTNNPKDIELLIAVDNDDLDTQKYIKDRTYPFNVKVFTRDRSDFFNRDYYNWLAHFSKGKYLWAIGNDVVFKIKDWDNIISDKIEEYLKDKSDRIVCVGVKDDTPKPDSKKPQFSCFPIITRDAYDVLGTFLHSELNTWGADYTIYTLYKQIERYFLIHDKIYIGHMGYHTNTTPADDLTIRMGYLQGSNSISNDYVRINIIPGQVKKIKTYIASKIIIEEYRNMLKREPASEFDHYVNYRLSDILTNIGGENIRNFVAQGYRDILKREPDPGGFEHYINYIYSGKMTKDRFLETLRTSEEYKNRFG